MPRARDSRGRYLARRTRTRTRTVTRYRNRTVSVRGRRRRIGSSTASRKVRIGTMAAAGIYGYLKENTSFISKIPHLKVIGPEFTWGVAAHYLAKHFRSRVLDHASTALLAIGAYRFGMAGFNPSSLATMQGDPLEEDSDSIEGYVEGYDDDESGPVG